MDRTKRTLILYTVIFLLGGCLYCALEIVFRQYTHISMFFAGGLCLFLIALTDELTPKMRFFPKILICGLIITAVEFIFGIALNIILKLNVWDYRTEPYNLLGQICPSFSVIWVLVSALAVPLVRLTGSLFDGKEEKKE